MLACHLYRCSGLAILRSYLLQAILQRAVRRAYAVLLWYAVFGCLLLYYYLEGTYGIRHILCSSELLVIANQWYWMYGIQEGLVYSYATREHELLSGDLRLLGATQYLVLAQVWSQMHVYL